MIDLDKLEALAKAVPDPWPTADERMAILGSRSDAKFIAACDPTTIVALIDAIRRMRILLAIAKTELDDEGVGVETSRNIAVELGELNDHN